MHPMELPRRLAQETGVQSEIVWDATKPDGQPRRVLETSRASDWFGFKAQVEFRAGLRQTIEWYRASQIERAHEVTGVL